MLPSYVRLEEVDRPIRELVVEANRLPFIDTVSVCSGHLDTKPHSRKTKRITEDVFFSEGWFSFQTDGRYEAVPDFVKAVEEKALAYPFASFLQEKSDAKDMKKYLEYLGIYSSNYFSVYASGKGLSSLEQAETRLNQIYEMWSRLADVCRCFRERSNWRVMF